MSETREIRTDLSHTGNTISGYAIVFNTPAYLRGIKPRPQGFTEIIRPNSLRIKPDLRLLWGHDRNTPLANLAKGTMTANIDEKGLFFTATLPDSASREREAVARGDADGMSFHFNLLKDNWQGDTRELLDIAVDEISITAFPAYSGATVSMRSKREMQFQLREKYRG